MRCHCLGFNLGTGINVDIVKVNPGLLQHSQLVVGMGEMLDNCGQSVGNTGQDEPVLWLIKTAYISTHFFQLLFRGRIARDYGTRINCEHEQN